MPLNESGAFSPIDDSQALAIANDLAQDAGLDPAGAVERILIAYGARLIRVGDNILGDAISKIIRPTGTDLSLQNPGNPRLPSAPATGFVRIENIGEEDQAIDLNTIFTAPNGNEYSTYNNAVIVPAGQVRNIGVQSVVNGADQNLPQGRIFTGGPVDCVVTNPQPYFDGRDEETDAQYLSRIIDLRTSFTSQNSTRAAEIEIEKFYNAAKIYVNNQSNALTEPIPAPPNGYTAVVKTISGADADFAELKNAFQVIANRFQFVNGWNQENVFHPVKTGTIYSANIPQQFFLLCAQPVTMMINATLVVKFADYTDAVEKKNQAFEFARAFAQSIVQYFGGAEGEANVTFTSDYYSPEVGTVTVYAENGLTKPIAPAFSIEQIRALISEASNIPSLPYLNFIDTDALEALISSGVEYEAEYELNINGPLKYIDFEKTALFSDNTSWFDRYVFIDPELINIEVHEL